MAAAMPAAATPVAGEAQLRAAFADPSTTSVTLGGDVTLTDCEAGDVQRPLSAPALTLDGGGFTITQTCAGFRVLADRGAGLTLRNVTVTGGTQAGPTGDEGLGGGVYEATGPLTLDHTTIDHNTVAGSGDPQVGIPAAYGGGVYAGGPLVVMASTVGDNTASGFGAEAHGGGIDVHGTARLEGSTLSGNTARSGNHSGGGGIASVGDLTLVNSTVSGNSANGIDSFGGGIEAGRLSLVYSTVAGNGSDEAGNVSMTNYLSSAFGSVVANPVFVQNNSQCGHALVSLGHNASPGGTGVPPEFPADTSCGFTNTAAGDLPPTAALHLGSLAANGGPTQTILPGGASALIDAIPLADCQASLAAGITTDQRGVARPQGSGCDIGAVEVAQTPVTTVPGPSTTIAAQPAQPAQAVAAQPTFTG
jgi:hypothetical protein